MTIPAMLAESEEAYARAVIEADLARRQQLTSIREVMANIAAQRHEAGLTVDHDDLALTLNREETRLELDVSTAARLTASLPGYLLILREHWAKTMKRDAASPPPLLAASADVIMERITRLYLRFANDIQTFEHDLAIAAQRKRQGEIANEE